MPWKIRAEKGFSKYLRRLGAIELKNFESRVRDLGQAEDPSSLGEFIPTLRHGRCYVTRLTKSCRLAYRVFRNANEIELACVGDHKEVEGKDKHS